MKIENNFRRRKNLVDAIKKSVDTPIEKKSKIISDVELYSTGSTLLDLLGSNRLAGGLRLGKAINFVGDSSSGKTFFGLSCLAEAAVNSKFNTYQLIYDDVENGCEFDVEFIFGNTAFNRIKFEHSNTIEEVGDKLMALAKKGTPYLYVIDSYDLLDCDDDIKHREKEAKAREKGDDSSGSYHMMKAKRAHEMFRTNKNHLQKTLSSIIVISQTKDNINPISFVKKKRNAENALEFNCSQVLWFAKLSAVKNGERVIGNSVKIKYTKNRNTGYKGEDIEIDILSQYGIDDMGSCVDFLVEEKVWKKEKATISCESLELSGVKKSVIRDIEKRNLEQEVRKMVADCWVEIFEDLKPKRKPRYA